MDDRTLRTDLASYQVTATLPKVDDQRELARQLMLGGYDPEHLDPLLRPAYDAFVQVWKHPNVQEVHTQIQLAARSQPPRRSTPVIALKAGDQMIGMYSYADQPDGSTTFRIDVPDRQAEARGTSANTSFQVKLPTVTQQEYQAELARRKQVRDDAATHALKLQQEERETLQQRTGFWGSIVADTIFDPGAPTQTAKDHATDALKQARRQYEQLLENGKDVIIYDRLRSELAKEQYRDRVGEYHDFNDFTKGLVDVGTGALAIPARAIDAWNGNENQMEKVAEIQRAYEGALPGSSRREFEGGHWNHAVQGTLRTAGSMAPFMAGGLVTGRLAGVESRIAMANGRLGIAGGGSAATLVGQDQLHIQERINALRASGDHATADRLSTGRDLHSLLTGILAGSINRLSPLQTLRPSGKGLGRLAFDTGLQAVENPAFGIAQRALVDPLLDSGHLPDLGELLAPVPDEMLSGLLLGAPMAAGAHLKATWEGSASAPPATDQESHPARTLDKPATSAENDTSHGPSGSDFLENTLQYLQGLDPRGNREGEGASTGAGSGGHPDTPGYGLGRHSSKSARKFARLHRSLVSGRWLSQLDHAEDGAEHQTFFDPAQPGWRIKVTGPNLRFQDGTPRRLSEVKYLERLKLANMVFGDKVELIGVITTPKGDQLITRQPEVAAKDTENPYPDESEVKTWLEQAGFELGTDPWRPKWTRHADGVEIKDAHPGNFIKTEEGLRPIDLQLQQTQAAKDAGLRVIPWEETSLGRPSS